MIQLKLRNDNNSIISHINKNMRNDTIIIIIIIFNFNILNPMEYIKI